MLGDNGDNTETHLVYGLAASHSILEDQAP